MLGTVAALTLVVSLSASGQPAAPALPEWFPPPSGHYEVGGLAFHAYDEFNLHADPKLVTGLPRNSGGYALVHGRVWTFELNKPQPDAWTSTIEQLQKQGFKFVHGDMSSAKSSATLMKGEGEHAVFVAFWQCCNAAAIIEPAPNPFHVKLTPPAKGRETFAATDEIPYLSHLDGSTLTGGVNDQPTNMSVSPACTGKTEPFGTNVSHRIYSGPSGASAYAIQQTYEAALREAGWEQFCESGSNVLHAHYTRNGRDIWAYIRPSVSGNRAGYELYVADAGSGLRKQLDQGCKAALYGVNFDFNKATLRPDSEPALNQVLALMKESPKLALEIGGHTDDVGDAAYNMRLSDQRAAAVVQWLVAHGVASSRLGSHGYGQGQPLVPNTSDENRAKNRRVELKRTDCK